MWAVVYLELRLGFTNLFMFEFLSPLLLRKSQAVILPKEMWITVPFQPFRRNIPPVPAKTVKNWIDWCNVSPEWSEWYSITYLRFLPGFPDLLFSLLLMFKLFPPPLALMRQSQ